MSDGTQLNPGANGDLIADEDMTSAVRGSPLVPQLGAANAAYKLERTKIAIGAYGEDRGDPTLEGRPFPVEMGVERRLSEVLMLREAELVSMNLRSRSSERASLIFSRTSRETGRF